MKLRFKVIVSEFFDDQLIKYILQPFLKVGPELGYAIWSGNCISCVDMEDVHPPPTHTHTHTHKHL